MTERQRVMGYLSSRISKAWIAGRHEEATDCHCFLNALELMTDKEYDECYGPSFITAE